MTQSPPLHLLAAFNDAFHKSPEHVLQTPGYDLWVAANIPADDLYVLHAPAMGNYAKFSWQSAKKQQTIHKRPLPKWSRYAAGTVYHLCGHGLDVKGIHAVILGNETPGVRYDYAIGVTIAALWHTILGKSYSNDILIDIVDQVRRDYIG
mgnify:CR=1 FL=1